MTITLKVSDNTKKEMIEFFQDYKRPKTPQYAIFQADDADTVVTLYESGKAVFQGVSADISANIWMEREKYLNPNKTIDIKNSEEKKKEKSEIIIDPKIYYSNSIGSDEVGTGDFFGPIVVTAAYVSKDNIKFLEDLGVKDSKKLDDNKIMEIVPKIIKKIPYKSMILTNKEYNLKYSDDINMNKIKAILHNKVLVELSSIYQADYIVVDEFAKAPIYYNYLKNSSNVCKNITFMTKGESKVLSVACASMISRYIFIHEFDKLSESVDTFLPKGASDKVDLVGSDIAKKYGFDKLKDIAKLNFKNTEKIKKIIDNL